MVKMANNAVLRLSRHKILKNSWKQSVEKSVVYVETDGKPYLR